MEVTPGPFHTDHFKLGHWTDPQGVTGCTVLLAHELVPAAVDIRGGSPGTRETDLLGAGRAVQRVDAVVLTGGSAFGLATADGVMRWLYEQGRGYETANARVPIVAGAVIYDLTGSEPTWPGCDQGYLAVESASDQWHGGRLGGGTGASVSKALGRDQAIPSGVGVAQLDTVAGKVSAVFVNNAVGDVYDPDRATYLTRPGGGERACEEIILITGSEATPQENTVIGAIAVDRPLDHDTLTRLTVAGQAGVSRVIRPAHTPGDGDTVFALASGAGTCSVAERMQLATAAQIVSARALLAAVST